MDLPQAEDVCQAIDSLLIFNQGPQVTVFSMVTHLMEDKEADISFFGYLDEAIQHRLVADYYTSTEALRRAMSPLLNQRQFDILVIGAEIDEASESLWVWLDDAENPM